MAQVVSPRGWNRPSKKELMKDIYLCAETGAKVYAEFRRWYPGKGVKFWLMKYNGSKRKKLYAKRVTKTWEEMKETVKQKEKLSIVFL